MIFFKEHLIKYNFQLTKLLKNRLSKKHLLKQNFQTY